MRAFLKTVLIIKIVKTAFENELNYFETIILGVSPGTTYHVKAYATNLEGTGYSAEKEITT